MEVWNPRCSAKGLDLGLELGLRGERVGALGRVGEGVVDGEFRGDWRGDC